jgi:hypothetical protein
MRSSDFFNYGLIFSLFGVGLIDFGLLAFQQVRAMFLSCEANHPPNVSYSCYGIFNGASSAYVMQGLGTLLIVLGIAMILFGFFRRRVDSSRRKAFPSA